MAIVAELLPGVHGYELDACERIDWKLPADRIGLTSTDSPAT